MQNTLKKNSWDVYSLLQWFVTLLIGTAFIVLAAFSAADEAHAAPAQTVSNAQAVSKAQAIRAEQQKTEEHHYPQWYREYESADPDGSKADAGDSNYNTSASERSLNRLDRLNSGKAGRQAFSRDSEDYNASPEEVGNRMGDRLNDAKDTFQEATQRVLEGENNPIK